MSIDPTSFPIELQPLIAREMAKGGYESSTELVRDALEYWAEHRDTIAALEEAVDEIDRGEGIPWNDADRDFRHKNGLSN